MHGGTLDFHFVKKGKQVTGNNAILYIIDDTYVGNLRSTSKKNINQYIDVEYCVEIN